MILQFVTNSKKPKPGGPVIPTPTDQSFNYTVLADGYASARIAKNGKKVRGLFGFVSKEAGVYNQAFDGLDDDGVSVAAGTYDVDIVTHNLNAEWEGVVGNTSYKNGALKSRLHKGLDPINDMCFHGTRGYRVRGYGEGSTPVGYFNLSNIHEVFPIFNTTWPGPPETQFCATDGTVLLLAAFDPYNANHSFVYGANISDLTKKNFTSGVTPSLVYGDVNLYGKFISDVTAANSKITGLAIGTNHYFIARAGLNQIQVTNKEGAFVRNITITSPRDIKIHGSDMLVITNDILKAYTINADGTITEAHTFTGLTRPRKVAFSPDGDDILVIDNGVRKIYQNGTYSLLRTLGTTGGYSSSSVVEDGKLYLEDLRGDRKTFAAYQPDGGYWVGDGGNFTAIQFNDSDTEIDRIQYIPRLYQADKVRNAEHRKILHDGLEFQTGAGVYKEDWEQTNHWGYSLASANYNQYIGLRSPIFIDGKTFALVSNNGTNSNLQVVELVPGGNVRFTGLNFSFNGQFYEDGSFRYMVESGSNMQYWRRDYTGLSGGNMTFAAAVKYLEAPKLPVRNGGTYYNPGEITDDGVIIACESTDREGYHLAGYNSSGVLLWKALKSNSPTYSGSFPTDGSYELGNRTLESKASGPGDKAMVYQNLIFVHYFGEFWKGSGGQTNIIYVFNSKGIFLYQFGYAQPPGQQNKPVEGMAGNAFSPFLTFENGNLYLYHNDEGAWAGLHRWKITGLDTIDETTTTVTVTTSPGTNQPPTNYRIGLNTTSELKAWKDRYVAKNKFYAKSDVKTNSPGIVSEITILANQLLAYPYIDRFTGPTYYNTKNESNQTVQVPLSTSDYIRKNSYPEPGNKGSRVKAAAILAAAGETKYITPVKNAILDFIAQPINQFPDHSSAWPGNGTRWKPNEIGDINPLFIYAQYFKKYIESYDLIKGEFTATQKTAIEDCFYKFCLFAVDETNAKLDDIWTNRDPVENKHATGYTWNGDWKGDQQKMFDGTGTPKASKVSLYLNNRRFELLAVAVTMGILKNDDYLLSSAYVFVKEWLKYGCYPWNGEVLPGELERASEGGFNDKGVSYSLVQVGLAAYIAHYFEILNDPDYPSLFGYTTTEGYAPSGGYSSVGGPKSIGIVGKSVLKLVNGELNLTYNGVKLDGYRESPLWHFTEDTTLAGALYAYYKDPWFEKSALRSHPGSRPFPAGGQGSGAYKPYEGFGGGDWWLFTRFFYDTQTAIY